jgi:ABC-type antimicrobial peptide transport system permease subunit
MALGILIVFLSSSLIANTLAALLQQHTRHIGVIKLIGGREKQVLGHVHRADHGVRNHRAC